MALKILLTGASGSLGSSIMKKKLKNITILGISFKQKKNELIAEKYIQAGLLSSSKSQEKSKKIYEEIILSENNFYSILSLNTILEENLITDKNKILEYFSIVEKLTKSNDQLDLIFFKKALFLIKKQEITEGKAILEKLINKKSKYKFLAEEVLEK